MARDIYIAPRGLAAAYNEKFGLWHAVPVDEEHELISALFNNDLSRDEWESIPGIVAVGNELSHIPIGDATAEALGIAIGSLPKDVRKHIRTTRNHPLF